MLCECYSELKKFVEVTSGNIFNELIKAFKLIIFLIWRNNFKTKVVNFEIRE